MAKKKSYPRCPGCGFLEETIKTFNKCKDIEGDLYTKEVYLPEFKKGNCYFALLKQEVTK